MTNVSLYKSPEGEKEVMALYQAALSRWPVPYEALAIDTSYGRTAVIANGERSAPPLVLLHGANSNATAWLGDVAEYSRSFWVCAVDVIGEPGQSAPTRPAWQGPAYADWLTAVLDGLQIQTARLLGISQGGWIALKFATANPECVEKLVLLAPGGVVPPKLWFLLRAIPLSMLGRRGAETINRIVLGRQTIHPEAVKYMNAIMTHFKPRIEAQPMFSDEALKRLTMPTLLIAGRQDALLPSAKTAARLKPLLPRLTVELLPEAGHMLHNTAARVSPFLTA